MESLIYSELYVALWAEMGLGKTAATLHALAELIAGNDVQRVLVIAPKRVAEHTWPSELQKWSGLAWLSWQVLTLQTRITSDRSKTGKQVRTFIPDQEALDAECDIHIVGRENFAFLARWYGKRWPYDTVVIDEADGFRSPSSLRFRGVRHIRPYTRRIIELTGTPASEGYLDLWAPVYLLDKGKRLGRTYTEYQKRYFETDYMRYHYSLRPGAADAINKKLSDICLSLRTEDYLSLPDRIDQIIETPLSDSQLRQYKRMKRDYVAEFEGEEIAADTAAILANKLLQLSNGIIYTKPESEDEARRAVPFHGVKLDALELLLDQADSPVLIAYSFQGDRDRIEQRFRTESLSTPDSLNRWNAGKIGTGLIHPANAAGLNLQDGGHTLVWYGLPWSLRQYKQTNARLHRQGQTKPVFIYHLIAPDTYDTKVMSALAGKDARENQLLHALRAEI